MNRCCEFEGLLTELLLFYEPDISWQISNYSESRTGVLHKPFVKKVSRLSKTLGNVAHQLDSKFVHNIIVLQHKVLKFLSAFHFRPRCHLM
jgi:hypothetical protein